MADQLDHDLAADLSAVWNQIAGASAAAEDLWPVCEILAEAGLARGDELALGVRRLGPYTLVNTPYKDAVDDFVSTLFPAAMIGVAAGKPEHGAVTGALSGVCRCFVGLLRRSVVLGPSEPDLTRWLVLAAVRQHNEQGQFPSSDELARDMRRPDGSQPSTSAVTEAVDWLAEGHGFFEGSSQPLLERQADGRLRCLV